MAETTEHQSLPPDLPVPADDGAADHLPGRELPSVALPATSGGTIDLSALPGRTVAFCFPRAGRPGESSPAGWDEIPGARGCTPQSCAFRDHYQKIRSLHAEVYGISTQPLHAQQEIVSRLHLPYPLLSDARLELARALDLPTFEVEGTTMLRRLTLIVTEGVIEKVFYPVFPPDKSADEVIVYLLAHPRRPAQASAP